MPNQGLLDDINGTFYGGGNAYPSPTPTATPNQGSWFSRFFGGSKGASPTPTPTANQFSMTDRMNKALGAATQFDIPAVNAPRDPLTAAIHNQFRFAGLPAAASILNSTYTSPISRSRAINGTQVLSTDSPEVSTIPINSIPVPLELMYRYRSRPDVQAPGLAPGNTFAF